MKEKIIKVDDQREIIVLDDAYNYAEISGFYKSAIEMQYQIYNSSDAECQHQEDHRRLAARLDIGCPFMGAIFKPEVTEYLKKHIPQDRFKGERVYMNLGIHSDEHRSHVDQFNVGFGKTVLVYINKKWDVDWGGETAFYDDKREELLYMSQIVPGRILIFDGSIPHSAKPQHFHAQPYRFTLAIKFAAHGLYS